MNMRNDLRHNDEGAIDRTLAALTRSTPPEGMEARINQRLRYAHAVAGKPGPVRASIGTWWFGALTGVAVASLVFCIAALALRGEATHPTANSQPGSHGVEAVTITPVAVPEPQVPCAAPAIERKSGGARRPMQLRAGAAPAKPATTADHGLTPQERELVRLTQVANPKDLSTMSTEARAALDAQQAAAFQKFFTPPPPPPHDEGVNE